MTEWHKMTEAPPRYGAYLVQMTVRGVEMEAPSVWTLEQWANCFAVQDRTAWTEFGEDGPSGWEEYLLVQGDPRWGDHVYAGGRCYTLRSQGCFITCCAMAQRILGVDPDATPLTVDLAVGPSGYNGCLLSWGAMREKLGLSIYSTTFKAAAMAHLAGGDVVFIEVQPSSMMHFVCAVEWDGTDFVVLDPLKGEISHLKDLYAGTESYRLVGAL